MAGARGAGKSRIDRVTQGSLLGGDEPDQGPCRTIRPRPQPDGPAQGSSMDRIAGLSAVGCRGNPARLIPAGEVGDGRRGM